MISQRLPIVFTFWDIVKFLYRLASVTYKWVTIKEMTSQTFTKFLMTVNEQSTIQTLNFPKKCLLYILFSKDKIDSICIFLLFLAI